MGTKRRRSSMVISTTLALVAIASFSRGDAVPGEPPIDPDDPQLYSVQEALNGVVSTLEPLAKGFDANFSALSVDAPNRSLIVYRAAEDPSDLADRYRPLVPSDFDVRYSSALLTDDQVLSLSDLVLRQRPLLPKDGADIQYWGLEEAGGPFVIASTGPLADNQRRVFQVYGDPTVEFKIDRSASLGRFDNTTPFYGGARG